MKEWALKHPWMTFFLVSGAVSAAVTLLTPRRALPEPQKPQEPQPVPFVPGVLF